MTMSDETLVARFENGSLDPHGFGHREHLRLAYAVLRRQPVLIALRTLCTGLRRLASDHGLPERYHETMTIAYALVLVDRMRPGTTRDFEEFIAANADLLERNVLDRFYSRANLLERRARDHFVLPDAP
jgi:hypothetical protein